MKTISILSMIISSLICKPTQAQTPAPDPTGVDRTLLYKVIECKIAALPNLKNYVWNQLSFEPITPFQSSLKYPFDIKEGQAIRIGGPTRYSDQNYVSGKGTITLSVVENANREVRITLDYHDFHTSGLGSVPAIAEIERSPKIFDTRSGYMTDPWSRNRKKGFFLTSGNDTSNHSVSSSVSVRFKPSKNSTWQLAYCKIDLPEGVGRKPNPLDADD